jgi:acetyl/propionyl-CoA carboxylase alpha subunit
MTSEIYFAMVEGIEYRIEILSETKVIINGTSHDIDYHTLKKNASCSLLVDGKSFEPNIFQENGGWEILLKGGRFNVLVEDERERQLRLAAGQTSLQEGRFILQSPMPGLVIDIPIQEGDEVEKGDVLVILESMKMQNELTAPRAGKVTRIQTTVNDNVERKQTLLILE